MANRSQTILSQATFWLCIIVLSATAYVGYESHVVKADAASTRIDTANNHALSVCLRRRDIEFRNAVVGRTQARDELDQAIQESSAKAVAFLTALADKQASLKAKKSALSDWTVALKQEDEAGVALHDAKVANPIPTAQAIGDC